MKGFHWETYNISRYVFLYSYSYPYVFYVLRRFEAIPKGYKSHSGSSYQWKVFFFFTYSYIILQSACLFLPLRLLQATLPSFMTLLFTQARQMHRGTYRCEANTCARTHPFTSSRFSFPQLRSSAEAMYPDGTDGASCCPQVSEG